MPAASPVLLVVRGLDPVGTGRQVELAAAGLMAAGLPVVAAFTTAGGSLPGRLAASGIEVHRLGGRPVGDLAATLRLVGLARGLAPRAILGFGRTQLPRVVAAARSVRGCRGLAWLGLPPRGRWQSWGARRLDRVLAASPHVADACRRAGAAAGRITVLAPAGQAAAAAGLARAEIAARLGLDPARRWTLAVAPLEPEARLPRLLWAIDQLGVVRKDLEHVLVGAGPLLDTILRRARAQEVTDRLVILPECDLLPDLLGELALVWQSGDVALGGALLDGLARGVPSVAVESDPARQLVADGVTGRIVAAVPESEFPRRAFGILEDEPLARRYGAAGAARAAEEFPLERFAAGIVAAVSGGGR